MAILWKNGCNFLPKMRFWAKYWMYRKSFFSTENKSSKDPSQNFLKIFAQNCAKPPRDLAKCRFLDFLWI